MHKVQLDSLIMAEMIQNRELLRPFARLADDDRPY